MIIRNNLSCKKRRDKGTQCRVVHSIRMLGQQRTNLIYDNVLSQSPSLVDAIGAMAQLVARPPPERKVGSSSLSGLTIFCP